MASPAALARQAEKRENARTAIIQEINERLERIEAKLDALAEPKKPAPDKPKK